MFNRGALVVAQAAAICAALSATLTAAQAFDETLYPDWRGQWGRVPVPGLRGNPSWDPHKSEGRAQEAPLTPEYAAIHEASLADQRAGGPGLDRDYVCYAPGMPRMMNVYAGMEIVVMPDVTRILMVYLNDIRRIYTDGRDWPDPIEPSFAGYSIGRWIDEDGDGRFDTLEVETRGFSGLRLFDSTGLPLHADNGSIIKERIRGDAADRDVIHDEITVIDHALTRPWTVTKSYRRAPQARPVWRDANCVENNLHVRIGDDSFLISGDGLLMPAKKDQPPPDLRYFQKRK
jgi:hypothetical protein